MKRQIPLLKSFLQPLQYGHSWGDSVGSQLSSDSVLAPKPMSAKTSEAETVGFRSIHQEATAGSEHEFEVVVMHESKRIDGSRVLCSCGFVHPLAVNGTVEVGFHIGCRCGRKHPIKRWIDPSGELHARVDIHHGYKTADFQKAQVEAEKIVAGDALFKADVLLSIETSVDEIPVPKITCVICGAASFQCLNVPKLTAESVKHSVSEEDCRRKFYDLHRK